MADKRGGGGRNRTTTIQPGFNNEGQNRTTTTQPEFNNEGITITLPTGIELVNATIVEPLNELQRMLPELMYEYREPDCYDDWDREGNKLPD